MKKLAVMADAKTLYKLYKKAYNHTGQQIFIRAMKKLGLYYRVKAFFFRQRTGVISINKDYSERLSSNEWGNLYNSNQLSSLVSSITNKEYYIQTAEMLKLAKHGQKTLEIASGTGQSSICLALMGCEATALDFEEKCIELTSLASKELGVSVRTICCDALGELPFKEKEFDIIFHSGLMEHFTQEERIAMFKHWRPYCKKMVSMVPNASSIAYRTGKAIMEQNGTWQYGLEMPIASQCEDFLKAGYEIEKEYSIGAEHALTFLDKKNPLRECLKEWIKNNPCDDDCRQGYLLVTIATAMD